jgi:hypothetical protein
VVAKLSKVDLKQKLALRRNLVGREMHVMVYLVEELMSLSCAHEAMLLVILGDVTIDPLTVGYV